MERVALAGGACLAAVGVVIAILAGAFTASAQTASHRVRLTAVQLKQVQFGNTFVFTEKDLVAGKVVGYDSVRCHYSASQNSSACTGAFARARGLTYMNLNVDSTGHGSGRITGGTGAYHHATGTVHFVGVSHTRSRIIFVYNG
jgi:hypothetical protein